MDKLDPGQLLTCIRNACDEERVRKDLIMNFPDDKEFLEKATISFAGIRTQDDCIRFLNIAQVGDDARTYEFRPYEFLY